MLNIHTEYLENHTARLIVEVDEERLQRAMARAARDISRKGRIPGFRPGKAPLNVVMNLYGREYVLSEALDSLGNEIYREALEQAEIEPYAPGSLENVDNDGRTLTFVVPLRPTVDLGDYRSIREPYEVQDVTEQMVEDALENLREEQADLEPVDRPAEMGDRITFDHIEIVALDDETDDDRAGEDDAAEDEGEQDEHHEHDEHDEAGRVILHQHGWDRVLRDDNRDLFPGFSAQFVGVSAGEEKTFTLDVPEDFDAEDIRGRTVRVEARVGQIRARTLPEWSDELASKISNGEHETIDALRAYVRQQLEESARRLADQKALEGALEKLVAGATLRYPDELVEDYLSDLVAEFDYSLRQQGLTLQDFMKITGQTEEQIRQQYRPRAIQRAERALALGELVRAEELDVSEEDIEAEVDEMSTALGGDQAGQFRQFLMSDRSRANIANRLATDRATGRLLAIAKGENPPKGPTPKAEAQTAPAELSALVPPQEGPVTKGELQTTGASDVPPEEDIDTDHEAASAEE